MNSNNNLKITNQESGFLTPTDKLFLAIRSYTINILSDEKSKLANIRQYILNGADLKVIGFHKLKVIELASHLGLGDVVKLIADTIKEEQYPLDAEDIYGCNQALMKMVELNDYETVKSLLEIKASPNAYNNLHLAIRNNNKDIFDLLLSYGADLSIAYHTDFDLNLKPIVYAACLGNTDFLKYIAENNPTNLQDSFGYGEALLLLMDDICHPTSSVRMTMNLIKFMGDAYSVTRFIPIIGFPARTLLLTGGVTGIAGLAIILRQIKISSSQEDALHEIMHTLIKANADINSTDWFGNTCLHMAAYNDKTRLAFTFLLHGAQSDIKNIQGKTAKEIKPEYEDFLLLQTNMHISAITIPLLQGCRQANTIFSGFNMDVLLTLMQYVARALNYPDININLVKNAQTQLERISVECFVDKGIGMFNSKKSIKLAKIMYAHKSDSIAIKNDIQKYFICNTKKDIKTVEWLKKFNLVDDNEIEQFENGTDHASMASIKKFIKDCSMKIKNHPKNADLYHMRGCLFQKKDSIKKSFKDYAKAIELNPQIESARHNLAKLLHGIDAGVELEGVDKPEFYACVKKLPVNDQVAILDKCLTEHTPLNDYLMNDGILIEMKTYFDEITQGEINHEFYDDCDEGSAIGLRNCL